MGNFAHCCILNWGKGFQKTVPFDSTSNTPTFFTASSSKAYRTFTSTYEAHKASFFRRETVLTVPGLQLQREAAELDPDKFIAEENLHLKKDGGRQTHENITKDDKTIKTSNLPQRLSDMPTAPNKTVHRGPLTFNPLPTAAEDDDMQVAAANDQAKLMRWHYRLGHPSFPKLKHLSINGKMPKKLSKVKPPTCAGCLLGAMTKNPWCGKESKSSHEVFVATKPGETVSCNQMALTKAGFFAQLKGTLTKKRYKCATIFVDHYSRLRFVHLQINNSAIKTIAEKQAFETFAAEHGVRIQHYHCNNRRFHNNTFQKACHDGRQRLTFCGVNTHFQNGIAERAIQDLNKSSWKQLLHTRARWPAAVHFALWPYALCNAALLHNSLPVLKDGTSRLEIFSSIRVETNMKHVHTFACPVFALQNALALGNQLP
jgi:hypothetical protein